MQPFYLVNAFTSEAFAGNPAAGVLLSGADWPEDAWMLGVAAQFNLSETAFALPRGDGTWALRWMTPAVEIDLCGHATLATAHALWLSGRLAGDAAAEFETRSGRLSCRKRENGLIAMDFPALAVQAIPAPEKALAALGVRSASASADGSYLFLELESEAAVRAVRPDFAALCLLEQWGVCITARAASEGDFVSRFFGPRKGVPEDPVTGSSHCRLAPYWGEKLGKSTLWARQLSRRGGTVGMELEGSRVTLLGRALCVGEGSLHL
jgi:PhzF family phenazine biosynthesis protein